MPGFPSSIPKFLPGFRMPDGYDLQELAGQRSTESGITATPSGTQATSFQITSAINNVSAVANAADGVRLPPSYAGAVVFIVNSHASNACQVFAHGTATINGVAGSTGVSQAAGKSALYVCPVRGQWFRLLSA